MPAWPSRRPERRRALLAAGLLLGSLATGAARAEFSVQEAQLRFAEHGLELNARLELALSASAEEALSKGIPLEVVIDVALYQPRRLLWDKELGTWQLRRRIQYHALSGQYLITDLASADHILESVGSLSEALVQLGSLRGQALPLRKLPNPEEDYSLQLRAELDIEALPSPLRPVAYTSPSWHLSSGWTTWRVQP